MAAGISRRRGHVTLPAATAREASLLAVLRERFGHVSAERALSGPGLVNLYEAACRLDGESPAGIPFQPLDTTSLQINLDAARAQNLEVPPAVLARAQRVIGKK